MKYDRLSDNMTTVNDNAKINRHMPHMKNRMEYVFV